ncbi:MAG: hypothetical protein DYH14_15285 [Betaproteobacteria bacterium PRO3]|nr:hypothetical protein [Betaproteobacteria bacterium PRO3]
MSPGSLLFARRDVNSTRTEPSACWLTRATMSASGRLPTAVPVARSWLVIARPLSCNAPIAAAHERSKLAGTL